MGEPAVLIVLSSVRMASSSWSWAKEGDVIDPGPPGISVNLMYPTVACILLIVFLFWRNRSSRPVKGRLANMENDDADMARLMRFYNTNNPEKATTSHCRTILKKYQGQRELLWEKLSKKYDHSDPSEQPAAAQPRDDNVHDMLSKADEALQEGGQVTLQESRSGDTIMVSMMGKRQYDVVHKSAGEPHAYTLVQGVPVKRPYSSSGSLRESDAISWYGDSAVMGTHVQPCFSADVIVCIVIWLGSR